MGQPGSIHPTAIVDPRATVCDGVTIGAFTVVKGAVVIGAGSTVFEHTVLQGPTEIGRGCRIGPGAYVGTDPQHLRFVASDQSPTFLLIGDNVTIRENARLHRATAPGRENATRVGDNCFIMGAAHVGHDCVLERDVTLADAVLLGGHCWLGERSFLGGGCTVHQFVRVGRLAVIAGNEAFSRDVPPFGAVLYGRLKGFNLVGCRRAGLSREAMTAIRACYHRLRTLRVVSNALAAIRTEVADLPEVREVVQFIESSRRGILPAYPSGTESSRLEAAAGRETDAAL